MECEFGPTPEAVRFGDNPSSLKLCQQAKDHVEKLREESEDKAKRSDADSARQAARRRASSERAERTVQALRQVEVLHARKKKRKKGDGEKARCSTTDPDARKMKMGDGGFRPAYNFQFATDGDSRMIVAVELTNSGSDRGEMAPMHQQVVSTYGKAPQRQLVDSAFAIKEDVTTLEQSETEVYSTVHGDESMKKRRADPFRRQRGDSDEYAAFRQRMSEPASPAIYQQRPSIAEFPNAECRNRGCRLLRDRGLEKVKSVALLYASMFNLLRMMNLKAIQEMTASQSGLSIAGQPMNRVK